MHSFDTGQGVYKFSSAKIPKRNIDWKNDLIEKLAIYNNMTVDQVKKYLKNE